MNMTQIIKKPIITEKALKLKKQGVYIFKVAKEANKPAIKQAIEQLFGVKVIKVNTVNVKGKLKKTGRRRLKKRQPSWKKAFVKLKSGQKIDLSKNKSKK